jgi:hypothetical protein
VEVLRDNAGNRVLGPPPWKYLDSTWDYLLEDAQKNISLSGTIELEAEEILREHEMFPPSQLKVVAGRGSKFIRIAYDASFLPLLPHDHPHPLSRMMLEEAHGIDHGGTDNMVMRSPAQVWIVQGRKLAQRVKSKCFACKRIAKVRETQKIGPLPFQRMGTSSCV